MSGVHRALEPLWTSCALSLTHVPILTTLALAPPLPSPNSRPFAPSRLPSLPSILDVTVAAVCVCLNLVGITNFDTHTSCLDGCLSSVVPGTAGVPCTNIDGSRTSGTSAVAAAPMVMTSPYVAAIATWMQIEMFTYGAHVHAVGFASANGAHDGVDVYAEFGTNIISKTPTPRAVLVLLLVLLLACSLLTSFSISSASLLLLVCAVSTSVAMKYPLGDGAGSLSRPARASAVVNVGGGHLGTPSSEAVANLACLD